MFEGTCELAEVPVDDVVPDVWFEETGVLFCGVSLFKKLAATDR